jgi:hypothetical protein
VRERCECGCHEFGSEMCDACEINHFVNAQDRLAGRRDVSDRERAAVSRTYGELPESIRERIDGSVWDNKTPSEQRDWLADQLDGEIVSCREQSSQFKAARARIAELEQAKPKCPDCNSVGMSHCSDPENCGGLYWPDRMYRDLEARNVVLKNALERAHACATLRADGTCDGCFVSAALKPRSAPASRYSFTPEERGEEW